MKICFQNNFIVIKYIIQNLPSSFSSTPFSDFMCVHSITITTTCFWTFHHPYQKPSPSVTTPHVNHLPTCQSPPTHQSPRIHQSLPHLSITTPPITPPINHHHTRQSPPHLSITTSPVNHHPTCQLPPHQSITTSPVNRLRHLGQNFAPFGVL
jgi:hypothetical protein